MLGTIADREHRKWIEKAVPLSHNPYSKESLEKRLSRASVDSGTSTMQSRLENLEWYQLPKNPKVPNFPQWVGYYWPKLKRKKVDDLVNYLQHQWIVPMLSNWAPNSPWFRVNKLKINEILYMKFMIVNSGRFQIWLGDQRSRMIRNRFWRTWGKLIFREVHRELLDGF